MIKPDIDSHTGYPKWNTNAMFVPFKDSRMLSYPMSWGGVEPEWRHVESIRARLRVDDYERGRSSVIIWVVDVDTDIIYPLSFADWYSLFLDGVWDKGECSEYHEFTFKKRGANYFLVPKDN